MAEIRHLENRHDVIFFCRGWFDLDKISQIGTEWHVDCGDVWKWKPDAEFQYGGRLGQFDGMSSQSHVSNARGVARNRDSEPISLSMLKNVQKSLIPQWSRKWKLPGIHVRIRITIKSKSLLWGSRLVHVCQVWSTHVCAFVNYRVYRMIAKIFAFRTSHSTCKVWRQNINFSRNL